VIAIVNAVIWGGVMTFLLFRLMAGSVSAEQKLNVLEHRLDAEQPETTE